MTLEEFRALRALQDHRVQLTFSDRQILVAQLLSVTTDLDESQHLVYDKVEWSALPHPENENSAFYAAGEDLVSCVECSTDSSS